MSMYLYAQGKIKFEFFRLQRLAATHLNLFFTQFSLVLLAECQWETPEKALKSK